MFCNSHRKKQKVQLKKGTDHILIITFPPPYMRAERGRGREREERRGREEEGEGKREKEGEGER